MEAFQPPYSSRAVASMNLQTDAGTASVQQVCQLFGLSRAAYYAAKGAVEGAGLRLVGEQVSEDSRRTPNRRPSVSAAELGSSIRRIVADHPAWGVRKVWATLRREEYGIRVGQRRVWATMKALGLVLTPDRSPRQSSTYGHVVTEGVNRRWATDLTTVWTAHDGLVAVVPVVDCGCRSVLALAVTKAQDAPAVLAPVREALEAQFGSGRDPHFVIQVLRMPIPEHT